MIAHTPASIVDMNKVMMDGTFRAISIPVTKGTISNQGVIVNVSFSDTAKSSMCAVEFVSMTNPITVKMISVIISDGVVVINI